MHMLEKDYNGKLRMAPEGCISVPDEGGSEIRIVRLGRIVSIAGANLYVYVSPCDRR